MVAPVERPALIDRPPQHLGQGGHGLRQGPRDPASGLGGCVVDCGAQADLRGGAPDADLPDRQASPLQIAVRVLDQQSLGIRLTKPKGLAAASLTWRFDAYSALTVAIDPQTGAIRKRPATMAFGFAAALMGPRVAAQFKGRTHKLNLNLRDTADQFATVSIAAQVEPAFGSVISGAKRRVWSVLTSPKFST